MNWSSTASAVCLTVASLALVGATSADSPVDGDEGTTEVETIAAPTNDHLSADDTIGDLLSHPAFEGFAPSILPWDGRPYDPSMSLRGMRSLMPYHSEVDPEGAVAALNRMIDDVNDGNRVFYDFYEGTRPKNGPTVESTGLFYFRGEPGAPFAIVAPGGGFSYVGSLHEGFPYAQEVSRQGYNAFVLRYRTGVGRRLATEDLAAALSWIVDHAEELGVASEGYVLWGSSAGARMAASIGSHGAAEFGGPDLPKPSAVVMAYTGHSDHAADEPPTFVVVGEADGIAPPSRMLERVTALRELGAEVVYREYPGLGHGFGLGTGTRAAGWIDEAIGFWERFVEPNRRPSRRTATPID